MQIPGWTIFQLPIKTFQMTHSISQRTTRVFTTCELFLSNDKNEDLRAWRLSVNLKKCSVKMANVFRKGARGIIYNLVGHTTQTHFPTMPINFRTRTHQNGIAGLFSYLPTKRTDNLLNSSSSFAEYNITRTAQLPRFSFEISGKFAKLSILLQNLDKTVPNFAG